MYKAKEDNIEVPNYLSAPPDGATPAEAVGLAFEGSKYSSALVLATFIDLTERGFYNTYSEPVSGHIKLMFEKADKNSTPKAKENRNLTIYEKSVRRFFDEVLGNKTLSLEEMRERIEDDPGRWNTLWVIVNRRVREGSRQAFVWEDTYWHGFRKFAQYFFISILIVFAAVLLVGKASILSFLALGIPLVAIVLVWVLLPKHYLNKMTRRSRERSLQWQAFARWTKDFPRLKDVPPISIELWESIITYSIAFETANSIIEEGSLPEKLQTDALTSLQMMTPVMDDTTAEFLGAFSTIALGSIWLGSKFDVSSPF